MKSRPAQCNQRKLTCSNVDPVQKSKHINKHKINTKIKKERKEKWIHKRIKALWLQRPLVRNHD